MIPSPKHAVAALTFAVSALTSSAALAENAPAPAEPAPAATPLQVRPARPTAITGEPGSTRFTTFAALAIVALGGGLWLYKRRSAPGRSGASRTIHVAARQAIGVRSELIVVEVDGHGLLLGVTPGGITRLAVLPDAGADKAEMESDVDLDIEPGFRVAAAPAAEPERDRDRDRDRERERDMLPVTVPEPRRPAAGPTTPERRGGPRARVNLPLEEQVRGLMRDRRLS